MRDRNRRTEGLLSLAVLLTVLPAMLLVYLAKMAAPLPAGVVDANTATAPQLARALGVDTAAAQRIVDYRARLGGFDGVDEAADALRPRQGGERGGSVEARTAEAAHPRGAAAGAHGGGAQPERAHAAAMLHEAVQADTILSPGALRALVVRTPASVAKTFWLAAGAFALVVLLLPAWIRSRRIGGDPYLLPLAFLLVGLGAAMLFSIKDPLRDRAVYLHHLLGLVPALGVMCLLAWMPSQTRHRIKRYQYVWVFAAAGLAAALWLFGSGPDGVKLDLLHFQPVEAIKLMLAFFVAAYLADHADLIADTSRPHAQTAAGSKLPAMAAGRLPRIRDVGPMAIMFGWALLLFYFIKDLGPGLLMFGTFVAMLYMATGRAGFAAAGLLLVLAGGFLGYYAHIGVFPIRVDMWLHPFHNSHANGLQLAQSYWAIGTGGWEGSGLGLGMPGLIPRAGSDLAFTSWIEETGAIGGWLVLVVFVVLVWRGLKIALAAANSFDQMLALGLTSLLGLQALLIVGGVTGAFPLTGISLPFLSYGNSALVADFAILGLLRGISSGAASASLPLVPERIQRSLPRFACVFALALLGWIGLGRVVWTQAARADEIAVRPVTTPDADGVARPHLNPRLLAIARAIPRGSIYDRSGRVLATSRPDEIGASAPNAGAARQIVLAGARWYPFRAALAHTVGYLNPGAGGPYGLERAYDTTLRGYGHIYDLLADYRDRFLPGYTPRRGSDLQLSIDARLQERAYAVLLAQASRLRDAGTGRPKDRGALVVMDPRTGDVLAAASTPSFDPNGLTPGSLQSYLTGPEAEAEHPLIDRATEGLYPPGSTLKVATAACALDDLPGAMDFAVACNRVDPMIRWRAGSQTYVRRNTRDDVGDPAFGTLRLSRAFEVSSNIYFANLAVHIGASDLRGALANRMGFRHTPSPTAFDADLPDIGYGQGRMLASPLAMARLAAAVANGGELMAPRLVTAISGGTAAKRTMPVRVVDQAMKPQTAATLQALMRNVVTGGTAHGVFGALPVAGKTGTAQNRQFDRQPHSWFIGFAPYDAPTVAFACIVENGGYGKRVAAVACRDVLEGLLGTR